MFPKKGKPKAAEQLEDPLNPTLEEIEGDGEDDLENEDDIIEDEVFVENLDSEIQQDD